MRTETDPDAIRAVLRDLVALKALAASSVGKEPTAVASAFVDALVELLQLDFAFVRLSAPGGAGRVDVARGTGWPTFADWLEAHVGTSSQLRDKEIVPEVGGLVVPVGLDGDEGLIAAASTRSGFPAPIDELLLSLAASHAATAFKGARLIREGASADALRRIATLVAQGASSEEVFAAVTEELGRLALVEQAAMTRLDPDGIFTTVAVWSPGLPAFPIGGREAPGGNNVMTMVLETGRSARIDDYSTASGEIGDAAREVGYRAAIGTPIMVEGRLWGVMTAATTREEPLPADAEARLASFTELVATAIANADSRLRLVRLAEEQAALRRIATLVAEGGSPDAVFTAVTGEAGRLLAADYTSITSYEPDGTGCILTGWAPTGPPPSVGQRAPLGGRNVATLVHETRRPARVEQFGDDCGPLASVAVAGGLRSAVGAPISVEGRLWGAMVVGWNTDDPLPVGTESRLAAFTELLATAIGNAQARDDLRRVADEQAALRQVATLVANGGRPAEIFSAISDESGRLFGSDVAGVVRFDHEEGAIVLVGAAQGIAAQFAGARWSFDDEIASARVYGSGRAARMSGTYYASIAGPIAESFGRLGIACTIASPIVVEGRPWGAVFVASTEELPPDAEDRLEKIGELVATAIVNAESRNELTASRKRIVAAWDEARRRIERDLHDGTQQRLASLILSLRALENDVPPADSRVRSELSLIATGLIDAIHELQEFSRGIHPAILARGGLAQALRTLAHRSAIPVELDISTDARLPEPIEVAAYYVASEALANAAKHAQASRIDASLALRNGMLVLSIRDNGVGGADPGGGSGLVGLTDRVEAIGGTIRFQSPRGEGTQIVTELPLSSS